MSVASSVAHPFWTSCSVSLCERLNFFFPFAEAVTGVEEVSLSKGVDLQPFLFPGVAVMSLPLRETLGDKASLTI